MATSSHGHTPTAHQFSLWPTTQLGWWAAGLGGASLVLILSWRLMRPLGGIPGFACGFAAGIIALLAIFQQKERAISVFAAVVPFMFVVFFVLAELIGGHS